MFDLDQTFSPYILPYEKMFDRLATSAKKACASGKKLPIRDGILVTSTYFFSGNTQKALCWLTLSDVGQTLFARLATENSVTDTDKKCSMSIRTLTAYLDNSSFISSNSSFSDFTT